MVPFRIGDTARRRGEAEPAPETVKRRSSRIGGVQDVPSAAMAFGQGGDIPQGYVKRAATGATPSSLETGQHKHPANGSCPMRYRVEPVSARGSEVMLRCAKTAERGAGRRYIF